MENLEIDRAERSIAQSQNDLGGGASERRQVRESRMVCQRPDRPQSRDQNTERFGADRCASENDEETVEVARFAGNDQCECSGDNLRRKSRISAVEHA